jgi:hypothetical protein
MFVVMDMVYLYKISSQALNSDPNHAFKTTYLSRISTSHQQQQQQQQPTSHDKNSTSIRGQQQARQQKIGEKKIGDTTADSSSSILYQQAVQDGYVNLDDKEPILEILSQAGLTITDIDQSIIDSLPTWTSVQKLYGTHPHIIGLEKCQEFVQSTDPTIRFFGVAGTFNSGTNLVAELMTKNCQITERMMKYGNKSKGVRWQVRNQHGYFSMHFLLFFWFLRRRHKK